MASESESEYDEDSPAGVVVDDGEFVLPRARGHGPGRGGSGRSGQGRGCELAPLPRVVPLPQAGPRFAALPIPQQQVHLHDPWRELLVDLDQTDRQVLPSLGQG